MLRLDYKSVKYKKTLLFTKDAPPRMGGELSSISETEGADCRAIRGAAIQKSFNFITLYLFVAIFLFLTPNVYALEQIHGITDTGWSEVDVTRDVTWTNNTNPRYVRGLAQTNNNYSSGFKYHTISISNNVNALFSWDYSPYYTRNYTFEASIRYGTRNDNTNNDIILERYNSSTSNTGHLTGNTTVALNPGTYYAKCYFYGYRNAYAYFYSLSCNTSPSGLTSNLRYTAGLLNGVTLSWNTSTSNVVTLSKYNIYRSTNSGSGYTKIAEVNAGTTTYLDNTVSDGNTYYYVISDVDTNGDESPYSVEVSIAYPASPKNLTAIINPSNNAVLSWTAPSPTNFGHDGYAIFRGNSNSGPFTRIATVSGNTLTYTDTSVTISDGEGYFYVVTDIDSSSNNISDYSNAVSASNFSAPRSLTATHVNGVIKLNWTAGNCPSAKLAGYNIYRSTTSSGPYTKIGTVGKVLTYNDSSAEGGVRLYYVVTARNTSSAESDYSNEANSMIPTVSLTVSIDSSVAPEIVRPEGSSIEVPVNWDVSFIGTGLTITGYRVTIYRSNGTSVRSGSTSDGSVTSYTVTNVPIINGESYYAKVEVTYTVDNASKSGEYISNNSYIVITPRTLNVIDGWSGKDIAYSFFDNRVEAYWEHDPESVIVKYEIAVGTTPYGTDFVDWQEIGLTNRIALITPELASGTTYFTTVRGITQKKNTALIGCSNGFTARKDAVTKDTDALNFFNNARVIESLSTDNGKLTPTGEIANGNWKYYMPVTITEPGITDRVNAPCLVNFTIPAAQRPANISEFRVVDDQGQVVRRYNLTTPNNSTVNHPYIVFLVNMRQGETKTYYIYWGNNGVAEPDYGFVNNTDQNSLNAWTPYYTRKDMPAGMEEVAMSTSNRAVNGDDVNQTRSLLNPISKFYFFGENQTANWSLSTNGYVARNNVSGSNSYHNNWNRFIGSSGTILGKCICPLWCDLMSGTSWSESGTFYNSAYNPTRLIYTWIMYRYNVLDDAYKLQAVLYETGDIAIRYGLINPRALTGDNVSTDDPVNTSIHHTVGISNGDNSHYLIHTPLMVGINQNPTAFYQCMNAFDDTTQYGSIVGGNADYTVAHFESMVFDTRIASPKWTCLKYDTTVTGSRKIKLSYRTGNTPLPDNSWTDWTGTTDITSTVTDGEIGITTNGRYIQYRADFNKTGNDGTMELKEVRFVYGGISILDITSIKDGVPVTEVSQGETGIPLNVTIKNECSEPVNLAVATLSFTLNGHSATLTNPSLPFNIAAGELATLNYSIDIADNATIGECTIDALASVSEFIYDDGAQNPLTWTVKSKSGLVIDNVYSEYTKVTKGYSYNLFITLTNTGEADCMLTSIWPTYASGTYSFTFDPSYGLATGTYPGGGANTIIHGNETKTAKFVVEISSESSSGSDTLGAIASATNILSGESIEILTTDNPHIWTIQTPAELNLYDIIASSTLYRGQKNNNIILMVTNEGEAELEWYPGSSTQHINFTPVTGLEKSYENKAMVTEEPVINITSDSIVQARYKVDIKQDTATGTDRITADLYGKELNTGVDLKYERKPLPYTEWTIYSERVNTFADGAYSEEKDSFNLPSGVATLTVYAKVENLAANVEYIVHWIAPDGTEIETTTPIITSGQGYFGCWHDFFNSSQSGLYKIRVTDSLNLFVCCENTFEIVAPADLDASFSLPQYVTVNQPFVGSFTFINLGGAVIANATLVSTETVRITGTAQDYVVFTSDDTEAIFSPRLSDVPGYGQATTTFDLKVTQVGTIQLIASATGFDNNSGMVVSKSDVYSNICTVQNPPNVKVLNITKEPNNNTVYKNQKNLRITATLRNDGEATAVVTAASITFNIGSYEQELMGYPEGFEIELAPGQENAITLTFDVSVNADSDSGFDTLTINAVWYDKNWPIDKVSSGNTTWTIAECGIILSADPNFNYEQADYVRNQLVYVRAYGVTPNDTQYYRIRFYESQISQANQVPAGYKTGDQAYSGLLSSNDDGYVEHIYRLPNNAHLGTWSVTLESCGTNVNITHATLGPMLALQYFRVQDTPHMTAVITADNVSIENNDKIFVGDTFKVKVTVTSTTTDNGNTPAVNTCAIDFIEPYSLVKDNGAQGNVELVSGPEPATFTLRAGESKTFEYIYRATEYTGTGKFSFKSSNASYIAQGRNRNLWDHDDETPYDVFARPQHESNQIDIYIKSMAVDPETLQFGYANAYAEDYPPIVGLICGDSQEINMNLRKTGNYNVENIRLNSASLNGPIGLDGFRKSISSTYFGVDVASFSNPLENLIETTKVSLTIPYNQASGTYTSTMFLYSDANNNGIFDSGEVTAEFNVNVCVNECKVIKVNDKIVNTSGWSKGTTTSNFEVNYFNAGNIAFTNAKIIGEGELAAYINFSTATDVGNISVGEFKKAIFSATIPNEPGLALGTYIATYTIFEDKNGDNVHDKSVEPFDTFQVHMTIGELNFSITTDPLTTPTTITASPVETSFTAVTGVSPAGFVPLWIKNTSSNGMPLTRIKMKADNFNGEDNNGNHYTMASSAVEIYPGTLLQPLESGASDSFDIEVYIAPGTRSATYNTTLHFYSDDNDNNNIDAGETQVNVVLNVYVKPTEKVKVIDKPVSVTGMSSDVQDTFAECEFLCYNLGNVDLEHLKFEMLGRLVQKDVPDPASISASLVTFSFVGDTPFTAPYNSEFGAKVTIRVPKGTPDGVYISTVPCKIYNDNNESSGFNDGECFDEFQIWLQIGEMKIVIVNAHDVHGEPSELTNEGPFTVKNDGALTVTSVVATSTDFIFDGNVIPATASVFLASPKVGTLKPGFERIVNWAVNIPDFMPAGVYTGKIIVWSDTDNNGEIGLAEASATADVKVTVEAVPRLSIRSNSVTPTDIDELSLFVTKNSTVKSCVRLYNTGNTPIVNPISLEANNLVFMTNAITTDPLAEAHFSIDIDPTLPIPSGDYVLATITVTIGNAQIGYGHYRGEQSFFVKSGETVLCSDNMILDVEFGEKELIINPNPLIFDDVDNVIQGTVTASIGKAALSNIRVYEKSHCDRNEDYCGETTLTCITPLPVDIDKFSSSSFVFEIDVDSRTRPGRHIATWTFFEDLDGDNCFEEGEFFVDFQIHYLIPEKPQVTIDPPHIEAIDVAPGETKLITYTLTNTGNCTIDLANAYWVLPTGYIYNENVTEFNLGSAFQYVSQPTGTLAIGESENYVISITAPDNQELGTYNGDPNIPQIFQYNTVGLGQTIIDKIFVVRRGPMVASDTVYQTVPSDIFIATQPYFISAWICPGLPEDLSNQYGANLTVVRCDKDGKPKAALSVRMENRNLEPKINERNAETGIPAYSVYNSGAYIGIGPGIPGVDPATFTFSVGNDGKPIYGISGDPVTAIDESDPEPDPAEKRRLTFYRVYFAFEPGESLATDSLGFSIPPEEQDKIAILLTQSANEANTASTTVYFDGVKLEKMLFEGQDRPTTYHKDTTLVSPSSGLDVSGKHKHYEW